MCSNKILNFQESTTILNARPKNVWKLTEGTTYNWPTPDPLYVNI